MRYSLSDIIDRQGYVVLDGSMGTGLAEKGFELNTALWTAGALVTAPELVRQVHLDYFEAGADCGISDSYQATVPGFMVQGYTREQAEGYIALSVRLLKETGEQWWQENGRKQGRPHPVAAGAAGPYGAYLADGSEYTGAYEISEEDLREFHRQRAHGADRQVDHQRHHLANSRGQSRPLNPHLRENSNSKYQHRVQDNVGEAASQEAHHGGFHPSHRLEDLLKKQPQHDDQGK